MNRVNRPDITARKQRHTGRVILRLTELEDRSTPAVAGFDVFGAAAGHLPVVTVARDDGSVVAQVQAYDTSFRGGVSAALGEIDGNPNTIELVTGAGPGGGPHVRVLSIDATGVVNELASFFAFDAGFTGGLSVAAGDVTGDGRAEVVVGAGPGGGPHVKTFTMGGNGAVTQLAGPVGSFFAFAPNFRGGVNVAAGDLDSDGLAEVISAAGMGGGPHVIALSRAGTQVANFFAFAPDFRGGVTLAPVTTNNQLIFGAGPFGTFGASQLTFAGGSTTMTSLTPFSATPLGLGLLGVGNTSGSLVTPLSVVNGLFGTGGTGLGTPFGLPTGSSLVGAGGLAANGFATAPVTTAGLGGAPAAFPLSPLSQPFGAFNPTGGMFGPGVQGVGGTGFAGSFPSSGQLVSRPVF